MIIVRDLNCEQPPCVITIGNFDGIHLGHQALLKEVKKRASNLGLKSAVMTFDPNPKDFFSPDNIQTRIIEKDNFTPKIPMVGQQHFYLTGHSLCIGGKEPECPGTLYR